MGPVYQVTLYILLHRIFQCEKWFTVPGRTELCHPGFGKILVFIADVDGRINVFNGCRQVERSKYGGCKIIERPGFTGAKVVYAGTSGMIHQEIHDINNILDIDEITELPAILESRIM